MDGSSIDVFLAEVGERLGHAPLSEAKMMALTDPERRVVVTEDDRIVAVGVVADHPQADGSVRQAMETVVDPGLQFPAFERMCVEATLELADTDAVSAWSRRSTLDEALHELGFRHVRSLRFMVSGLPLPEPDLEVRPLADDEIDELISLNNDAFGGHREAGALTRSAFDRIAREPWFDLLGIVVSEDPRGLAAFCWTKVHPGGVGEVYRIGVRSDLRGSGLGRGMTLAGFADLSQRRGCRQGTLWVDEANAAAISLYESLGMTTDGVNREFERSGRH